MNEFACVNMLKSIEPPLTRRLPRRSLCGVGGPPALMKGFSYVYILASTGHPGHFLASTGHPGHFYIGLTDELTYRLAKHNSGSVPHTAKFRPWQIKTAIAFRERAKAAAFETYLKSPSVRAFTKKRL